MSMSIMLCAMAAGMLMGEPGDTIKPSPVTKAATLGRAPITSVAPAPGAQEQAAARALAAELANAGIAMDDKDLTAMAEAISAGGAGGMALAMMLTKSIAELSLEQAKASKTPGSSIPSTPTVSVAQVDAVSTKLPPDDAQPLTRYLKWKLAQVRTRRP